MTPFTFTRAGSVADAIRLRSMTKAKYLDGATNLVDLLCETIETPTSLIVTGLSSTIEERADGGLLIGAATRNTAVAEHRAVRTRTIILSNVILAGASAQIRNVATAGGDAAPAYEVTYFYAVDGSRCDKASPAKVRRRQWP